MPLNPFLRTTALAPLVLALAACGTTPPQIPVQEPPAASEGTSAPAGTPDPDRSASPEGGPVDLSTVHDFGDGLTVALTGISRATSTDTAFPTSAPYLAFTLEWENNTGEQVDLSLLSVTCAVGEEGSHSELVFDSAGGVESSFATTLLDGNTATGKFGCAMDPEHTRVQIELDLWTAEPSREVIFSGEVE